MYIAIDSFGNGMKSLSKPKRCEDGEWVVPFTAPDPTLVENLPDHMKANQLWKKIGKSFQLIQDNN